MTLLICSLRIYAMDVGPIQPGMEQVYKKISEYINQHPQAHTIPSNLGCGDALMTTHEKMLALYDCRTLFVIDETTQSMIIQPLPEGWPPLTAITMVSTQQGKQVICGDERGSLYYLRCKNSNPTFNQMGVLPGKITKLLFDATSKMIAVQYTRSSNRCGSTVALSQFHVPYNETLTIPNRWVTIPCVKALKKCVFEEGTLVTEYADGSCRRWSLYYHDGEPKIIEYDDGNAYASPSSLCLWLERLLFNS